MLLEPVRVGHLHFVAGCMLRAVTSTQNVPTRVRVYMPLQSLATGRGTAMALHGGKGKENTPFRRPSCQRRKGSSRRQQTAYGAAVNEVARELLHSERRGREKMAAEGTSRTPGRSPLQSVLVSAVDSCHCPHPSPPPPTTALLPIASLSLRPGLMHSKM